jgi:AbrB family looped-hinge helix DNA binding protein
MPDGDATRTLVSTDGRVSLPRAVRERHGWTEGTVLEIVDGPEGVTLRPARDNPLFPPTRPEDVRGILKYTGPPVSIEEMHKGIENEVRRLHALGRY